ncbi:MAG: hypothetical protein RLZZ501_833 [Pseudomonadota bacterium]
MTETPLPRLYLGAVDDAYTPGRDAVAGPWCLVAHGFDTVAAQRDSYVPAYPDETVKAADRHLQAAAIAAETERLTRTLNQRHGVTLPLRFWRLVLAAPILEICTRVIVRHRLFARLIARLGAEPREVVVRTGPLPRPASSVDLIRRLTFDPDFSLAVDSRILAALLPPGWRLVQAPAHNGSDEKTLALRDDGAVRLSRTQVIKMSLGIGDMVESRWASVLIGLSATLLPKRRVKPTSLPSPYPTDRLPDPAVMGVIEGLIDDLLPQSFATDFPALLAQARRVKFLPGRWRVGVLNRWNDVEKCVTALAREAGERIMQVQHGSVNYGHIEHSPTAWYCEYAECEAFATWGWRGQGDYPGRFLSLPSPWLSRHADRHRERSPDVILVAQSTRFNLTRLDAGQDPLTHLLHIENYLKLIAALPDEIRDHLLYRPYRHAIADIDEAAVVQQRFPSLRLLEGNLHQALLGCRLTIADNPSTSLSLAMAANTPILAYWDDADYPPPPQARPIYQRARAAGLLHTTPEAVARTLSAIWPDVTGWWHAAERQSVRRDWCAQFAKADRAWPLAWVQALRPTGAEA